MDIDILLKERMDGMTITDVPIVAKEVRTLLSYPIASITLSLSSLVPSFVLTLSQPLFTLVPSLLSRTLSFLLPYLLYLSLTLSSPLSLRRDTQHSLPPSLLSIVIRYVLCKRDNASHR